MSAEAISTREAPADPVMESAGRRFATARQLLRAPLAVFGLTMISIFVIMAIFAPLIAPYDPLEPDFTLTYQGPSATHPLGNDYIGRDILSRLIWGSRISLLVGFVAVGIASTIGIPLGLLSGYVGGIVDDVIMRFTDAVLAFPTLILALAIVAVLGSGIFNVMIAIGLTSFPIYVRLARAQTLSVKTFEFVLAATSMGASTPAILFKHILPNIAAPLLVAGTLGLAGAVLAEAALGFLGVGVVPPTPTWGASLSQGFRYIVNAPTMSLFPGAAIFLLVLSINFVGDALRDVLDPRLRGSL